MMFLLFALLCVQFTLARVRAPVAVSWGAGRTDVFGLTEVSNDSKDESVVWHKYYTSQGGWEPQGKLEALGTIPGAELNRSSVVSWGENRLDFFAVDEEGQAWHKYWDGTAWKPDGDKLEKLGGDKKTTLTSEIASTAWAENRLDLVARNADGKYVHMYWSGSEWSDWTVLPFQEDLEFESAPATLSWGPDRLDVFGVAANYSVMHLYWQGDNWVGWEHLAGTPDGELNEHLTVSSWGQYRMDVWATSETNTWHVLWDHDYYSGWEPLGEAGFFDSPAVVSWGKGRLDILGLDVLDNKQQYKFWDGSQWQPSVVDWYAKGDFAAPPVLSTRGSGTLESFAIDESGELQWQMWNESYWIPSSSEYIALGNLASVTGGDGEDVVRLVGEDDDQDVFKNEI